MSLSSSSSSSSSMMVATMPGTAMSAPIDVSAQPSNPSAAAAAKPPLNATKMTTLEMFRASAICVTLDMSTLGSTVAQIAEVRSLGHSTILNHLVDAHQAGDFPEAPQLLGLTAAVRDEIRAIDAKLTGDDAGKLKPIKERCEHDYPMIRLALVCNTTPEVEALPMTGQKRALPF